MGVPDVGDTVKEFAIKQTIGVVTKTVVDSEVAETIVESTVLANLQPAMLGAVKKEAIREVEQQRSWRSWFLFIYSSDLLLKIDDIVLVQGVRYRVDRIIEWRYSGYSQYQVIEDYE